MGGRSYPARPSHYHTVLKLFRAMCATMGFPDTGRSVRSHRNWFPSCVGQLGWSEEQRRKLGRWEPGSKMPARYDRAVCSTEILARNSILEMINPQGWAPTPEFEVPNMEQHPPKDAPLRNSPPSTFSLRLGVNLRWAVMIPALTPMP